MNIGKVKLEVLGEVEEEIIRCLHTLYSIYEGSQPLDREIGINIDFVGMPIDVMKNRYTLEIIEKTEEYEPRVQIKEIIFEIKEGQIMPTIYIEKRKEE